jgi:UDPglucose 6-dehydrogenase
MKITVIGSGYVGTTLAGILALSGHQVTALEVNEAKIKTINSGKAPFYEYGLDAVIAHGVKSENLMATNDYSMAISNSEMVFSCVGTPDKPDGSSDLSYVFESAKTAAECLKKGAIYIQKSTVPVGTGKRVKKLLPTSVCYVSNPEFLREGTSIEDTLLFDRIVAGSSDASAVKKVLDLHRTIEKNASKIARIAGLNISDKLKSHHGDYVATQLESAELIKVTANAFLALKISFANSIAKLCDETGADIKEVMAAAVFLKTLAA